MVSHEWINNHAKITVIYVTGWALDHTFFAPYAPDKNHLIITCTTLKELQQQIPLLIKKYTLKTYACVGFSLGALLLVKCQESLNAIKTTLIGLNKGYPKGAIDPIIKNIKINKNKTLSEFYQLCFEHPNAYKTFQEHHEFRLIEKWSKADLIQGLETLKTIHLNTGDLKKIPHLTLHHGEKDRIAPLKPIQAIAEKERVALQVYPNEGHILSR